MAESKTKLVEIKTKPTALSVDEFVANLPDAQKQADCHVLIQLMKDASKQDPVLWSNSIIGFGNKRYKSPTTGREVDWLLIGFSPRKANFSLHLTVSIKQHATLLQSLGKHKTGVGCLYINKLADIDINVLKKIILASLKS